MNKIEQLTPEQIAAFPRYVEWGLKVGLSTEPANRPAAEKAAFKAYAQAGLKPPKLVWAAGPLACAEYIKENKNKLGKSVESQAKWQVWSQAKWQVWWQVWSQVWSQVESQVESQVRSQVESQVRSQVWSQVYSQVWSQVYSQVLSQVRSQVESQVESQVPNNFFTPNYALYKFFLEQTKISGLEPIKPLIALAENSGWFAPFEDVCVLQERPTTIRMKNGKLHSLVAPSVEYAGGFRVYSLNGERLEYKEWLERTKIYHSKAGKVLFG